MDRQTAVERIAIAIDRKDSFKLGFIDGTEIEYTPLEDVGWYVIYHGTTPVKIDAYVNRLELHSSNQGQTILWGYLNPDGGEYIWVRMNDVKRIATFRRA